jgi:hypothetical protein
MALTLRPPRDPIARPDKREGPLAMEPEEEEHPKGALLLILLYLVVLALFWLNTYLRIWRS